MNSLEREIKLEKLTNNISRQKYLRVLSIVCLCLDLFAYIILESIEIAFTNLNKHKGYLLIYILKILFFVSISSTIIFSIMHNKSKLMIFSVSFYCIFGLGVFLYLIVTEMTLEQNKMRPVEDPKPEIYYSVFLILIIILNVIAGVLRILGCIFMMIYVRITNKIKRVNEELSENLNINGNSSVNTFNTLKTLSSYNSLPYNKDSITPITQTPYSNYKIPSHTQSLLEPAQQNSKSGYSFNREKDKYSTFIETKGKNNLDSMYLKTNESENVRNEYNAMNDVNIYINSNQATNGMNNIHVHVYNYGASNSLTNIAKNPIIPQMSACTYESDKNNDEQYESFYETPKRVSYVNKGE